MAPIAAGLLQMALSRSREYAADHDGAVISGHPLWLASALRKIEGAAREIPNEQAEENPASASLYIINPLSGQGMDNLFSTHPDTENRIAALQEQARQMGDARWPSGGGIDVPAAEGSGEPGVSGPWGRGPWERGPEDDQPAGRGPWG